MQAENRIEVFRWTKGEILARYTGPHAAQIVELFGTDTLPTAFYCDSCITDEEEERRLTRAAATIAAQNPGITVSVKA